MRFFFYETKNIIRCAHRVHTKLGCGYLEIIYHRSMKIECEKMGLNYKSEKPVDIYYDNHNVGTYVTDLIVNDKVLIELKAVSQILDIHKAQLLHYLKCTGIRIGLILNFGSQSLQIKRMIL